jgi:Bifunctional DNA primase/polymerase, N-terminal
VSATRPTRPRRSATPDDVRRGPALDLAAQGVAVFVLGRSKRPVANCRPCAAALAQVGAAGHDRAACGCLTCHGFYAATTDPDRILAMLAAIRNGMLAIRTGAVSGLVVADIDPRHGGQLDPTLMTPTATVASGGADGGWHLHYAHPGGYVPSRELPGHPGVDIKGDGGYTVVPPSLHPDTGIPYQWITLPTTATNTATGAARSTAAGADMAAVTGRGAVAGGGATGRAAAAGGAASRAAAGVRPVNEMPPALATLCLAPVSTGTASSHLAPGRQVRPWARRDAGPGPAAGLVQAGRLGAGLAQEVAAALDAATAVVQARRAAGHWKPGGGGISSPDALLAACLDTITAAPEGRRRPTLYGASRRVAAIVRAGALTYDAAYDALYAAGRTAGQSDRETRTAIVGAFTAEGGLTR